MAFNSFSLALVVLATMASSAMAGLVRIDFSNVVMTANDPGLEPEYQADYVLDLYLNNRYFPYFDADGIRGVKYPPPTYNAFKEFYRPNQLSVKGRFGLYDTPQVAGQTDVGNGWIFYATTTKTEGNIQTTAGLYSFFFDRPQEIFDGLPGDTFIYTSYEFWSGEYLDIVDLETGEMTSLSFDRSPESFLVVTVLTGPTPRPKITLRSTSAVPLPAGGILLATGLFGLLWRSRRAVNSTA
ncbi:MAG: hypothetical protein AAFQ66_11455 [Pseudomonadota bacterium]